MDLLLSVRRRSVFAFSFLSLYKSCILLQGRDHLFLLPTKITFFDLFRFRFRSRNMLLYQLPLAGFPSTAIEVVSLLGPDFPRKLLFSQDRLQVLSPECILWGLIAIVLVLLHSSNFFPYLLDLLLFYFLNSFLPSFPHFLNHFFQFFYVSSFCFE